MELFTVQRYNDDDSKNSAPVEDDILKKLLRKVEKRKRDRIDVEEKQKKSKSNTEILEEDIESTPPLNPPASIEEEISTVTEEISIEKPTEPEGDANEVEYQVLGEDVQSAAKRKPERAEIVLPPWLAHPSIISTCLADASVAENTELSENYPYLATHIIHSLKELKVTHLFPVQSAVIPWILTSHCKPSPFRPRDICVSAPTGSGKTLAFAVPVVQILAANRVERKVRALVVLPVAELAIQVFKVFKKLCEKTDLSVLLFSQQTTFAMEQENLVGFYKGEYHSKVDIVVTTPGRLVDHLHATKGFCLKSLKFLIIDEADRIMDAVFQNWYYHLDNHVRSTSDQLLSGRAAPICYNELCRSAATQPHKLLFSATLSQDPEKLQNMRLFQPKLFTSVLSDVEVLREHFTNAANNATEERSGEFIGKYTTPAELSEKYCITESKLKPLTLFTLIKEQGWKKFLCFTNQNETANRLAFVLGKLFNNQSVVELSGNMSHKDQDKCLSSFTNGDKTGLICTDVMARGIDVEVDVVISYDPPRDIKAYIHRIGRTARAGRPGIAVTILTQAQQKDFNEMLLKVGKRVTDEIGASTTTEESNAKRYSDVLLQLRTKIQIEEKKKIWAKRNAKSFRLNSKVDPAAMTLMQKLQVAVDNVMVDEAKTEVRKLEKLTRKEKKRKPKIINKKKKKT